MTLWQKNWYFHYFDRTQTNSIVNAFLFNFASFFRIKTCISKRLRITHILFGIGIGCQIKALCCFKFLHTSIKGEFFKNMTTRVHSLSTLCDGSIIKHVTIRTSLSLPLSLFLQFPSKFMSQLTTITSSVVSKYIVFLIPADSRTSQIPLNDFSQRSYPGSWPTFGATVSLLMFYFPIISFSFSFFLHVDQHQCNRIYFHSSTTQITWVFSFNWKEVCVNMYCATSVVFLSWSGNIWCISRAQTTHDAFLSLFHFKHLFMT